MKNAKLAVLVLLGLFMFSSCNSQDTLQGDTSREAINSTSSVAYSPEEQKIIQHYQSMSAKELVDDLEKSVEQGATSEGLIYGAIVLAQKADDFTEDEIYTYITSDKYSFDVRFIMIEICSYRQDKDTILNQDKYKKLLTDDSFDIGLKSKLMTYIDFESDEDKAILEDVIKGDEKEIVIRAFKRLNTFDSDRAVRLADEVIADYKNATIEQMQGANAVKAWYIREQIKAGKESEKALREQIDALKEMCFYGFEHTDDSQIKDSFIIYLSETLDLGVLGAIINNNEIDDMLKRICVDTNYPTFMRVLQNDLSEEDIDIVIAALNIRPFSQTYDLIEQNIRAKNQEQQIRLYDLLETIKTQGVAGDESLLEG